MRNMAAFAAAMAGLQGCAAPAHYDIVARVIDGRLAFVSAEDDYRCVAEVGVQAIDPPTPMTAAPGDDPVSVRSGVVWETIAGDTDCPMRFPLFYGSAAPGVRHRVVAKPLRIGVLYSVHMNGDGGKGHGCFEILPDQRVRNNLPCYGAEET